MPMFINFLMFWSVVMRLKKGNPHPEIFLSAAQKLNLEPAQCFMFEDSENGIRSAHDAGGHLCTVQRY